MNSKEFMRIFEDCDLEGNKIIIKSNLHEVIKFVVENYTYNIL